MTRALLFLSFSVLAGAAHAQAPTWQNALVAGQATGQHSTGYATATDAAGNVYVAGNFSGSLTLGTTTLTSTSPGDNDLFVAKWSPTSNSFVWAQRAGGSDAEGATALAVNGANVYLTGAFRSAAVTFGSTTLTNSGVGRDETFVAKLTDAGTSASFTWALRAGNQFDDYGQALAVNGANVYVVGRFVGNGSTTPTDFGTTILSGAGSYDAFVAKVTDAGATANFAWAQSAGGLGADEAQAVAVSGSSLYVAGRFSSATSAFGSSTLSLVGGGLDGFLTKLTDAGTTGTFSWTRSLGSTGSDEAKGVAVSGTKVYVAGAFEGSATLGPTTLTSTGSGYDMFVAKLDDAGPTSSFSWAKQSQGTGNEVAEAIVTKGSALYVAGYFFGPTTSLGATTLTGNADVFVTRLTDTGATASFDWALGGGSADTETAYSVALSGTTVYLTGYAHSGATFGNQVVASTTGLESMLLASITDATPLAASTPAALAGVELYPNPAIGSTIVRIPALAGTDQAQLTLTDALGRVVRTQATKLATSGGVYELSLTDLANGLYTLQVQVGLATSRHRLAVE